MHSLSGMHTISVITTTTRNKNNIDDRKNKSSSELCGFIHLTECFILKTVNTTGPGD